MCSIYPVENERKVSLTGKHCDREVQEELNVRLIAETFSEVMVVQEVAHGYTEPTQVTMRCFEADYTGEIMQPLRSKRSHG
jgi:hypothetical protein